MWFRDNGDAGESESSKKDLEQRVRDLEKKSDSYNEDDNFTMKSKWGGND